MSVSVIKLELAGLVAVHAARAAHTALTGVPGIITAEVTMAGAVIDVHGPVDIEHLKAHVRDALATVGVGLISVTVLHKRVLPLA